MDYLQDQQYNESIEKSIFSHLRKKNTQNMVVKKQ